MQTNLADPSKIAIAKEAVSKLASTSRSSHAAATSMYRDRALERRETFNQPDYPVPPAKRQKTLLPPPPAPVVSAPEKAIEEDNIGSKLLAGMGWTAGSGLGNSTPGRVDPIQAKAFARGAGIGASKGTSWVGSTH